MSKNEYDEVEFGVKAFPMVIAKDILEFFIRMILFSISVLIFLSFAHMVYNHLISKSLDYSFWDVFFPALGLWILRLGMISKLE